MLRQLNDISSADEVLTLGPQDHGRVLTLAEYRAARGIPGFIYELIDGALEVSPNPIPNHDYWVRFVRDELERYALHHPTRLNCITEGAELEVPGRAAPTRPHPDLAAYRNFPHPPPASWDDVCPCIVVEVISNRRAAKDTVRNRHLYWQVRGIAEYWIVDPEQNPLEPTLIALRRTPRGQTWEEHVIPFGKRYRSRALPGFSINLKRPTRTQT